MFCVSEFAVTKPMNFIGCRQYSEGCLVLANYFKEIESLFLISFHGGERKNHS